MVTLKLVCAGTTRADLPEEEILSEPSLSFNSLPTSNTKDAEQLYKIHPVHGALPPAPSSEILDSPTCDEVAGDLHPQYGMLPPRSDDMMCAQNDSCLENRNVRKLKWIRIRTRWSKSAKLYVN